MGGLWGELIESLIAGGGCLVHSPSAVGAFEVIVVVVAAAVVAENLRDNAFSAYLVQPLQTNLRGRGNVQVWGVLGRRGCRFPRMNAVYQFSNLIEKNREEVTGHSSFLYSAISVCSRELLAWSHFLA